MSGLHINIVYANLQAERMEVETPGLDATVYWTREEAPGSDVVVYFSGYSFKRRHTRRNPDAFRILWAYEPLSVYPVHYTRRFWKPFDAILTWNDYLAEQGGTFHRFPVICYDFPYGAIHGVRSEAGGPLPNPAVRRKALCQIVGDKYTPIQGQLYRARRNAARWFHAHGRLEMDVYGVPPMNTPNYKGKAASKLDTLRMYRYALCFENLYHPVWSQGYVTEKIFDCMYADCVPVYYGAYNIENYIPEGCFVDFRKFRGFADLDAFLAGQTDRDYLDYVRNIRSFLRGNNAAYRYSCFRLYETAAELARAGRAPRGNGNGKPPPGFWELARPKEKAAYLLMACGLKGYRWIHPMFNVIRKAGSWRNR